MTAELIANISTWLQEHRSLAYLIVFLVALSESLAVVGLLVPGAILMVMFGAFIATGHLSFFEVYVAACLGAIGGDICSYWLGKVYQQQLANLWPLSRHPELLDKGKDFFQQHGGKSVLLGRFVGPIRPIIPAVAGMMNMPVTRFTLINIISALLWAPLYLLPGILLGTSLGLASELAGRFAFLLTGLLLFLWGSYRLVKYLYEKVTPHTDRLLFVIMNWNRRHPLMGNLSASIIDPEHREVKGLTMLVFLLFISALATSLLFDYALHSGPLHNINMLVLNAAATIQSPPFDWLLEWFSRLGDRRFLLAIVILVSAWLAWQRNWVSIVYLLSALLVPMLIIVLLSVAYTLPESWATGSRLAGFNLPSGHSALSLSVYGFIAILLTGHYVSHARYMIYIVIAWLVGMIGFSRIYFASHLLTDVVAGFLLGLAWLTVLAIAYRRHERDSSIAIRPTWLGLMLISLLLASYPYRVNSPTPEHAPFAQLYVMTEKAWLESGWQSQISYREDIKGRQSHPLNLQYVGDEDRLLSQLEQHGWEKRVVYARQVLQWFNPLASIKQLPLLPQVHDGQYDALRISRALADDSLLVLRLWKTDTLVMNQNYKKPLWLGNLTRVKKRKVLMLSYLYTDSDFNSPLELFIRENSVTENPLLIEARKAMSRSTEEVWNGTTLLVH